MKNGAKMKKTVFLCSYDGVAGRLLVFFYPVK